ncbi:MAG: biotin/lipoyl-binding protein, partial [Actinomycetota bacterium]|nr:biotin/lipoyl-binding protein [Actinomycetota bacterium]
MRRPLRCIPAVAGVAILLAIAGCSSTSTKGIRLGTVRTATVTEVVDAPAAVMARAMATVTSPAAGQVSALYVTDGQRVAAGTVLGIIASTATQQRLVQARQAAAASAAGAVGVPGADLSGLQAQTDAAAAIAFGQARSALAQIPDPVARAAATRQLASGEAQYAAARAQAQAAVRQFNAGLAGLGTALRSLTAAQQAQAHAGVALAQAAVDALTLRAPIAGTVQLGG